MPTDVVVLGSGYGGVAAIRSLESALDSESAILTWVSKDDYHLLLHETHRVIRTPSAEASITIPVSELKADDTRFLRAEVTGIDVDDRTVSLADDDPVSYDYLVVCLGSRTAFYGIDGLDENALTLKSLNDARAIREELVSAVREASADDPARAIVGGGGLTGIQVAGELAQIATDRDLPVEVRIVERSDQLFAGHDHEFQGAIRNRLERAGVDIMTGAAVTSVDESTIAFEERDPIPYDLFVWAGGVTGQSALDGVALPADHDRLYSGAGLETDDERVFALGDCAHVNQDADRGPLSEEAIWEAIVHPEASDQVPPTAEAAWEAGGILGKNVARHLAGRDLIDWTYTNKGTAVSIGENAVAHGVIGVPVNTFGGKGARVLKKLISARWVASITTYRRALRSWADF